MVHIRYEHAGSSTIETTSTRTSPRRTVGYSPHLWTFLSYRPPLQSSFPASHDLEEDEPFDETTDLHSTDLHSSSTTNPSPLPVTPPSDDDLSQSVNSNFEKVWQDAASHGDESISKKYGNNYVSEDEDHVKGNFIHD
jgi:hypothetical protein